MNKLMNRETEGEESEKEIWEYFCWRGKDLYWVKKRSNNKHLLQLKDQTQVMLKFFFYSLQMQTLSSDQILS